MRQRVIYTNLETSSLVLSSGVIRTALPNMDRETRDQYVLVIQAKDMVGQMGGLSGTTSVTVTLTDVNDNPPRFAHSKTLFLIVLTGLIKLVAQMPYSTATQQSEYNRLLSFFFFPSWLNEALKICHYY